MQPVFIHLANEIDIADDSPDRRAVVHGWLSPRMALLSYLLLVLSILLESSGAVSSSALHAASAAGRTEQLLDLLSSGEPINAVDKRGFTALHAAAAQGHADSVKALLDAGAAPDANGPGGTTPLQLAVLEGHGKVAEALLAGGADANAPNKRGYSALHAAAQKGDEALVQALVQAGADVDCQGVDGMRPLHVCAQTGHRATVQTLLKAGAKVDARVDRGTPLVIAARGGHAAVVSALLDAGAEVNARNQINETPLHLACQRGWVEVARALVASGADTEARNDNDKAPLYVVAESPLRHDGAEAIAELLLKHGADIDAPNCGELESTALHQAAWAGRASLVRVLLTQGAQIGRCDGFDASALHLAAYMGHTSVLQLLCEMRSDDLRSGELALMNAMDRQGRTPYAYAVENGHTAAADLLKECVPECAHADASEDESESEPDCELAGMSSAAATVSSSADAEDDLAGLRGKWRAYAEQEQRSTPLSSKIMIGGKDPATVPAAGLFRELAAAGLLKYFAFRSAQLALKRKREGVVYSEKGVLSQQACEVLRRAVDSHASTAPEPADGLPLEQLDLSAAQLEQMIGRDAAHALWRLPRRFAEQGGLVAAGAASGHGSSKADSVPVAPYSIFVRRYSAESRPFFRLHADNSVVTVNVALSSSDAHRGGDLIGMYDGALRFIPRDEAEAVVHSSLLLHAVTRTRTGSRYSLIMFFGRAAAEGRCVEDAQ